MNKPKLLSGGNPQIAKGYGEAPVQAWLDAVPDWRKTVCRRVDGIVSMALPGVVKAIKWNSPLYGMERDCWFLSLHVYAKYVKATFFRGGALEPPPPGTSKYPAISHYDIREGALDEAQLADWVRQASKLPGEKM